MKAFAITEKGIEPYCAAEIKLLIGRKAEASERAVFFSTEDVLDLCRLCYTAQTASRVVQLIFEVEVSENLEKTVEFLEAAVKKESAALSGFLDDCSVIRVSCERHGIHVFNSTDISRELTRMLVSLAPERLVPSFKEADVGFFFFMLQDKGYFGVDFAGRDLSKRQYRVFSNPTSVKAVLAASLVHASEPSKNSVIIDLFASSGEICIEAAHFFSKKPINFYQKNFDFMRFPFLKEKHAGWEQFFELIDKKQVSVSAKLFNVDYSMQNINAAKKNAKIAGLEKDIGFSRLPLEDVDLKFEKQSVDRIISLFPCSSKRLVFAKVKKMYNDFFRQASLVLKKDGIVCLLSSKDDILQIGELDGFVIAEKETWFSGEKEYYFFKIKRK
ncbi:MAG: hypothetical protein V1659_04440 [Candidatus Woesearchaeota archaeon]